MNRESLCEGKYTETKISLGWFLQMKEEYVKFSEQTWENNEL